MPFGRERARAPCAPARGPCCRRRAGCDRRRRRASSASLPPSSRDGDQREVGGAAADVAHEHDVADVELACASRRRLRLEPGVERGLRLLEQRDVLEPGRRAPPRRSARAPTASNDAGTVRSTSCCQASRRVRRCAWSHASREVLEVARRRPRPARPSAHVRRAPATAGSAPCDRRRRGTATTWPTRRAASAPASRGCARELADGVAASGPPHGSASCAGGELVRRPADRGTTAAAAAARPRRARRAAGSANIWMRGAVRRGCRRRRAPSWWCRDRCRRRSASTLTTAPPRPARPPTDRCPSAGVGQRAPRATRQPWWRKRARERRLAVDVADQPDARRDRSRRRRAPARSPRSRSTGSSGRCSAQRLLAAAMDVAHGGADLRVGVAVDVLLQEVDQAAFALQEGQELHRRVPVRRRRRWRPSPSRPGGLRRATISASCGGSARRLRPLVGRQQRHRALGQAAREQNEEETLDGEPQAHRADGVVCAPRHCQARAHLLLW